MSRSRSCIVYVWFVDEVWVEPQYVVLEVYETASYVSKGGRASPEFVGLVVFHVFECSCFAFVISYNCVCVKDVCKVTEVPFNFFRLVFIKAWCCTLVSCMPVSWRIPF